MYSDERFLEPSVWVTRLLASLAVVTVLVVGGAGLETDRGRVAILGLTAGAAIGAATVYYRESVVEIPRDWRQSRDKLWAFRGAILRAAGVAASVIAGAAAWFDTADWRWMATGLVGAAVLPGVVESFYFAMVLSDDVVGAALIMWGLIAPTVPALAALWSDNPAPGLIVFGVVAIVELAIVVGFALDPL